MLLRLGVDLSFRAGSRGEGSKGGWPQGQNTWAPEMRHSTSHPHESDAEPSDSWSLVGCLDVLHYLLPCTHR